MATGISGRFRLSSCPTWDCPGVPFVTGHGTRTGRSRDGWVLSGHGPAREDAVVPKSFYKGERLGSRPPCAICMGRGEGERARLVLPGGVSVWLCAAHRSLEFQRSRAGRDFHLSLRYVWAAAGCLTARRERALRVHRERLLREATGPPPRSRPGSYSWPELRREAEGMWAQGAPLRQVIDRLRTRVARGEARPPSRTTMYRWFGEARWRAGPRDGVALARVGPGP